MKILPHFLFRVLRVVFLGGIMVGTATASLQEALVNRTLNEVFIHENANPDGDYRTAQAGVDRVTGQQILRTGARSRAELVFGDQSIARIGSNAVFTFNPEQREMFLGRGLMLYQAPKNLGVTRISTATATASITGTTVLVEVGQNISKIILLEGSMRVEIPGRVGEYVELKAGQMLIFSNDSTRLPEPVNVDIALLVESSEIMQTFGDTQEGDNLNMVVINEQAEQQKIDVEDGRLIVTDLAILGMGSTLHFLVDEKEWLLARGEDDRNSNQSAIEVNRDTRLPEEEDNNDNPNPPPAPGPKPTPPPPPFYYKRPPLIANPNPFVLDSEATVFTNPHIVIGEDVYAGAPYSPLAGSLSQFLFGGTSQSDADFGINDRASTNSAWFRFTNLILEGEPAINVVNGVTNVGFIAEGELEVAVGSYEFASLDSLFLAANEGIQVGDETEFVNPTLHLGLYNRSEEGKLSIGEYSYFDVRKLDLLSAGKLHIGGGSSLFATDKIRLQSKGTLSLGDNCNLCMTLTSSNIFIEAGALFIGSGVWISPNEGQEEGSSLLIRTANGLFFPDAGGEGGLYWELYFGQSTIDVGMSLYGSNAIISGLTNLIVKEDAELQTLFAENVSIGGNAEIDVLYADTVNVGGNLQTEYLTGKNITVGGNLIADYVEMVQTLNVGNDLIGSQLSNLVGSQSQSQQLLQDNKDEELVRIDAEINVGGKIHLRGNGESMGIWWDQSGSLTLNAPRVVIAGHSYRLMEGDDNNETEEGIYGVYVRQSNGDGGDFRVYAEKSITLDENSYISTSEYYGGAGGKIHLEATDGYVEVKENAYVEASYDESVDGGGVKIIAHKPKVQSGLAIQVNNSSQIIALAENAQILLEALEGGIKVAGNLESSEIIIKATGENAKVEIPYEANFVADQIKIGALGSGGELLIGTPEQTGAIGASEMIKLYANSANGTVRFVGNTQLSAQNIHIAAYTVQVDNGVQVNVEGQTPANVYAEQHLYGKTGYGNFTGAGVTAYPVSQAPAF